MTEAQITEIQNALTGLVDQAVPVIIAVAIAGLALWGIPKLIGWVKRGLGR